MNFTADIDDARIALLAPAMAQQLKSDAAKRGALATFALEQIIAWITGQTSYQSMTDLQIDWLMQILPAFYPGEQPSAERLYNDFNIPFGRASYIARVLLEKQKTQWRALGRRRLRDAIDAMQGEADKLIAASEVQSTVPIPLDAAAYRELRVVLAKLDPADPLFIQLTSRTAGPGRRVVGLPSGLFATILKHLES